MSDYADVSPVLAADFPPKSHDAFIVQIKKAFINAFNKGFDDSHPSARVNGINVSMEYPMVEAEYPGIWVQFHFSGLQSTGLMNDFMDDEENEFHQWEYRGRISLNVLALTAKERDQIASEIIQIWAFNRWSPQGRRFRDSISSEPYINVSLNGDKLDSTGPGITVGTAFKEDQVVYEDTYSFEIIGQLRSQIDESVVKTPLNKINYFPQIAVSQLPPPVEDNNGDWI
jgi:hypothetical protein